MVKSIGFVINPIAGMGGRVGLKGTDGVVAQARRLGAKPLAQKRAAEMLAELARQLSARTHAPQLRWLTCAGAMGEAQLLAAGFLSRDIVVTHHPPDEPSAADTRSAVESFLARGVDLVLFCGGDGTARDICEVVGTGVAILGIPSGVKMYSGVFGSNPARTAEILLAFLDERLTTAAVDVLDLDESQYRADTWQVRLYHSALTPFEPTYSQSAKALIEAAGDDEVKEAIAESLYEQFAQQRNLLVLLGPGSSVKSVAQRWDLDKTLLGIDAIADGKLVGSDLNETEILELLARFENRALVLSPIGAQGFVLGRGNLQLSPEVIRAIGCDNIIVIATPAKLLRTPVLRFDTGDRLLDEELTGQGYLKVLTGYHRRRLVKTVI
jgi:predicted polyphosphate/ATP-dependent NAD kinase